MLSREQKFQINLERGLAVILNQRKTTTTRIRSLKLSASYWSSERPNEHPHPLYRKQRGKKNVYNEFFKAVVRVATTTLCIPSIFMKIMLAFSQLSIRVLTLKGIVRPLTYKGTTFREYATLTIETLSSAC